MYIFPSQQGNYGALAMGFLAFSFKNLHVKYFQGAIEHPILDWMVKLGDVKIFPAVPTHFATFTDSVSTGLHPLLKTKAIPSGNNVASFHFPSFPALVKSFSKTELRRWQCDKRATHFLCYYAKLCQFLWVNAPQSLVFTWLTSRAHKIVFNHNTEQFYTCHLGRGLVSFFILL